MVRTTNTKAAPALTPEANPRKGQRFGSRGPWLEALEPGQKMEIVFIEDNFETVFVEKFQVDKRQIRCRVLTHPHPDNPPKFEAVFETTATGAADLQADVAKVGDSLKGQAWEISRHDYGTTIEPL
ncbi:MAG TPA: hypothetical protein EYN66_12780 [Myxococcales bacterium]|nr:hypothetical protein [Myxococcales bacterium]